MRNIIFILLLLSILGKSVLVFAQSTADSANLNVNVVERKSTDTENDFVFDFGNDNQGKVLGAATQREGIVSPFTYYLVFLLARDPMLTLIGIYFLK